MKEIPPSFCGAPGESYHHYYRNALLEFKKFLLSGSKDLNQLLIEMEKFLNASKEMIWKSHKSGVWKKEDGEKAISRLFHEFKRYLQDMNTNVAKANPSYMIDVLDEIKRELDKFDVQ